MRRSEILFFPDHTSYSQPPRAFDVVVHIAHGFPLSSPYLDDLLVLLTNIQTQREGVTSLMIKGFYYQVYRGSLSHCRCFDYGIPQTSLLSLDELVVKAFLISTRQICSSFVCAPCHALSIFISLSVSQIQITIHVSTITVL